MSGRGKKTAQSHDVHVHHMKRRRTWAIVSGVLIGACVVALVAFFIWRGTTTTTASAGIATAGATGKTSMQELPARASPRAKLIVPSTHPSHGRAHGTAATVKSKPATPSPTRPVPLPPRASKPQVAATKPVSSPSVVATCPAGSRSAPTVAPTSKCTDGRASLAFCPMNIGSVAPECVKEHLWHVNKSAVDDAIADVAVCGVDPLHPGTVRPTVEFVINATVSLNATLLRGSGTVKIVNSGTCTTNLTSLLLLLERSGIPTGTGNSVGPSGQNHMLLSSVGRESNVVNAGCGVDGVAHICDTSSSIACNTPVPYESLGLHLPSALDAITIPGNGVCDAPVSIPVDFVFPLDAADIATIQSDPTGYRINVLATFYTCCERGSACGINIDCKGATENVRTVQVRSPSFSVDLGACEERCACLKPGLLDTQVGYGSEGCGDDPVTHSIPIPDICANKTGDLYRYSGAGGESACCNATVPFGCNQKNITIVNTVSIGTPHDYSCTSVLTGDSLITIDHAVANTTLECECIKKECPAKVLGTKCTFSDLCGGTTDCADDCASEGGSCNPDIDICECNDKCGTGDIGNPCGTFVYCGVTTTCSCDAGYACINQQCQSPLMPSPEPAPVPSPMGTPTPPLPPPPFCTWTRGAWTQSCTGQGDNNVTCAGTALVNPADTKPACVGPSCYADLCTANSNTSFFRLGNNWPGNPVPVYIDFNPCLQGVTVSDWGDLFTLVNSFVAIHNGPFIGFHPIPSNYLWTSIAPVPYPTGLGTFGAQLVTVMANRALVREIQGATHEFDAALVNISCLLNTPDNSYDTMSMQILVEVANCIASAPSTAGVPLGFVCDKCFGSPTATGAIVCNDYVSIYMPVQTNYGNMTAILTAINEYYNDCDNNAHACITPALAPV